MVKVLVLEHWPLSRAALAGLIEQHPQCSVVGQVAIGAPAIQCLRQLGPDVVVVQFDEAFGLGLRICEHMSLAAPEINLLTIVKREDHPAIPRLLEVGVRGLVAATSEVSALHSAILTLAQGRHVIAPAIAQHLALSTLPTQSSSPFESLTVREVEVALSLVEGYRMPAIAKHLNVSPKTVATYKYRIYDKLNVNTEVALFRLAILHGLVETEPAMAQPPLL